ncbi:helix-turn-helix domain-containing protein [Piscirickettsia salmonis]|uniref:helix-turn-helix domain-containing protein n=1 Tax=Piscirickettsia salmonis TaxID=1238 RepID=UPI001E5D7DC8|nr:helix-turn-helix domain-containing protein [Piscirickettsia salmonis]
MARALGFSPSTISREIKRHTPIDFKGLYCHRLTSRCAQEKRANAKQGQAFSNKFQRGKNVDSSAVKHSYIPRCYQSRTYT